MIKILPEPVGFNWDNGNLDKNWNSHRVDFREAEEIFLNRPLKTFTDAQHSADEKRFQALGITNKKRCLSIIFTLRSERVRIISARDMSKRERRRYEES